MNSKNCKVFNMKIFDRLVWTICALFLVFAPRQAEGAISKRTVQTKYGTLRGTIHEMRNTKLQPVEMFLGVPYAAPPIGALRFMPPVTPRAWSKVFLADRLRPVCPQKLQDISDRKEALKRMPLGRYKYMKRIYSYLKDQSEDCLHLNIYLPSAVSKSSNLKLPILVIIHGESYEWNSGNPYDGRIIASLGDLVVITVNFRLGLLGFLTILDDQARGNYGLMDQIAALHWIQENIEAFGGDPNIVTVMGHGPGAVFVDLLMTSPLAKGLFHRVMLLSGTAQMPRAIIKNPLKYTASLLKAVGCEQTTTLAIMKCLRSKSLETLMDANVFSESYRKPFGPVVDGLIVSHDPQIAIFKKEESPQSYDVMLGLTKAEHYFEFSSEEVRFGLDESKRNSTVENFIKVLMTDYRSQITAVVLNEYTDWTKSFQHPIAHLDATIEIVGDADIVAPVIKAAKYLGEKHPQKTFLFVFTHQTQFGDYSDRLGTIHGEELPYILGAPLDPAGLGHFGTNYTQSEKLLSKALMAYFINFIRRGNPNNFMEGDLRTRFNRFQWPIYEENERKCIALGLKPRVKDHYRAHKLSTWLNLVPKLIGIPDVDWIVNTTPMPSTAEPASTSSSLLSTLSDWIGYENNGSTPVPRMPSNIKDNRNLSRTKQSDNSTGNISNKGSDSTYIYSTALSVTIAVGCSLLILNIFAFVALYYKKQKNECTNSDEESSYKKPAEGSSQNSFGEKQVIVAPSELQSMFSLEKTTINCDSIDPRNREDIVMNCKRRETKIETAFDREIYETNYTTTFVRPNEINV